MLCNCFRVLYVQPISRGDCLRNTNGLPPAVLAIYFLGRSVTLRPRVEYGAYVSRLVNL